jgi:succinate-semialdehyde dehydrogenase / glutarate-semialdehyde dehydrogenase
VSGSPAYPELHMIIDGEKVSVGHRRVHTVVNPATGAALGTLPLADAADLDRALEAAQRGFRLWRDAAPQQRAAVLMGAARLLRERQ